MKKEASDEKEKRKEDDNNKMRIKNGRGKH